MTKNAKENINDTLHHTTPHHIYYWSWICLIQPNQLLFNNGRVHKSCFELQFIKTKVRKNLQERDISGKNKMLLEWQKRFLIGLLKYIYHLARKIKDTENITPKYTFCFPQPYNTIYIPCRIKAGNRNSKEKKKKKKKEKKREACRLVLRRPSNTHELKFPTTKKKIIYIIFSFIR